MSFPTSQYSLPTTDPRTRFLLARLHVDSLLDKKTRKKVHSTLENLLKKGSEALETAYGEAIKRIERQLFEDKVLAKSALSWITYAQRPLTPNELCHALATELGDDNLDGDNVPDIEDVVSVCAGLVIVDTDSHMIRLVHYTAQTYFEHIRDIWIPLAQQEITLACLTYLSFTTFRCGSCSNDNEFENRCSESLLFDYATRYWGRHMLGVQGEERVCKLAVAFAQDENLVSSAVQAMFQTSYNHQGYCQEFPRQVTGLHLAAFFGLADLAKRLLLAPGEDGRIIADSKDGDGQTALSWAASQGHGAVVELLVSRDDVTVNSKNKDSHTPLHLAAASGHEAVVRLLIEKNDVDVDAKDINGWGPLSWAACHGHEAVTRLLVMQDSVEVNSKDEDGRSPLSWAAGGGHEAVVKLLVELDGIQADASDQDGQTPLLWAAWRGNQGVVRLLLEQDHIDVDAKDTRGRTALSRAAECGHTEIVKLLAGRDDVNADSIDEYGWAPLSWAAHNGHVEIAKLLVELFGVNADLMDKDGRTPLSWAAGGGYEAMVRFLIGLDDVDIVSKDKEGRTPGWWAGNNSHAEVVRLLQSQLGS